MSLDFLDRFEQQLRDLPPLVTPRRQSRRRTAGVVLGVLAIAAPAVAATKPWNPVLGDDRRGHPTRSDAQPAGDALTSLAVLRRTQTEVDRGPSAERALQQFSTQTQGIMTAHVRVLRTTGPAAGATLVPIRDYQPPGESRSDTGSPQLCIFVPELDADGGAQYCVASDALAAQLPAELGRTLFGLVPDGVSRVRIVLDGGSVSVAGVRDNFYAAVRPRRARGRPVAVTWLGESGAVQRTITPEG